MAAAAAVAVLIRSTPFLNVVNPGEVAEASDDMVLVSGAVLLAVLRSTAAVSVVSNVVATVVAVVVLLPTRVCWLENGLVPFIPIPVGG